MKTLVYLLSGLISLTLVLIVAAAIYIANLDLNEHKDWIAERFEAETGRSLELNGDIAFSVYPWLGIEVSDLVIGNAQGFGPEPFLRSGFASVRLRLLPALSREFEIDTLRLHGTSVNLQRNADGRDNWSDFGGTPAEGDADADTAASGLPQSLVIGGIDVRDARIAFDDQGSGRRYTLDGISISSDELVYGEPLDLGMSFALTANEPELEGRAELSGIIRYDLDNQRYSLAPLSLTGNLAGPMIPANAGAIDLETALSVDLASDTLELESLLLEMLGTRLEASASGQALRSASPSYAASVDLSGNDLALLFDVAGSPQLAERIRGLDQRGFSLSSQIEADLGPGTISLPNLDATLLGANLSAALDASNLNGDNPHLEGTLSAAGPDLPTLLEVLGRIQGGADNPLTQYGRDFRNLDDKAFAVNSDFSAEPASGNIELPAFSASGLGFELEGRLNASAMQGDNGQVDGSVSLNNARFDEFLRALGQEDLAALTDRLALETTLSGTREDIRIEPFNLTLGLLPGSAGQAPGDLVLGANASIDLDAASARIDNLRLSGLDLELEASASIDNFNDEPLLSGNLRLAPFSPRQLAQRLAFELPPTSDPETLRQLSLNTAFEASGEHVRLASLELGLDDSRLSGSLGIEDFATPAYTFELALDRIDLDRYLAPASDGEAASGDASDELPLDALRALTIDGSLDVAQLGIVNLSLSEVALSISAADGVIAVDPVRAALYDGSYNGRLGLDASGELPVFTLESSLDSVAIAELSQDFIGASYLSGQGRIDLSLEGQGASTPAILASLNGNGNIDLADGVFSGVDIGGVLAQIETMIRRQRLMDIDRGEQTAFNNFSASIGIDNGIATSNDLLIESPGFRVEGQGTLVNLRSNSLDFDLRASVDRSTATVDSEEYDIGGYTLPIACSGNVSSPRCLPDTEALLSNAISGVIERELGGLLQRALGGGNSSEGSETESDNNTDPEPEQEQESGEDLLNRALEGLFR